MGKLTNAVSSNDLSAVKTLLNGSYKNNLLINNEVDADGFPSLHIAAYFGYMDILRALLGAGAKVDHPNVTDAAPLYLAAQMGKVEAVQVLLKAGAKVDRLANGGFTAFLIATKKGFLNIMEVLIKAGAKIDQPMPMGDGRTPLFIAAQEGKVDAVQLLIKAGAKVDQPNSEGITPLYVAAYAGHLNSLQNLLKAGAKIDQPDEEGSTPLWVAAQKGNIDAMQLLIKVGAKIDQPMNDGRTPLFSATENNHVNAMQILLNAGAKVDQAENNGFTPLFTAAFAGYADAVRILLKAGANTNLSYEGKTPLDIAKIEKHTTVVAVLEDHIRSQLPINKSPFPALNNLAMALNVPQQSAIALSAAIINPTNLVLGEKLGQGSFGVVYKGNWLHNDVAVKQLLMGKISAESAQQFETEVQVMAKLRFPNIVQFYGYSITPTYSIVMEYMPNGSLFGVLHSDKPLDWPLRYSIALDTAKGLAFLHQENILHRDIKSLNILLGHRYEAKLTDFGLSKVKEESKSYSMASNTKSDSVGTVAWMAPELFKRKAVFTQKSDVYSLGITLWELATRKIPFADAASQNLIPHWVEEGEREDIPTDCPKPLASLIGGCWAGNSEQRPPVNEIIVTLKNAISALSNAINSNQNPMANAIENSSQSNFASGQSGPQYQNNLGSETGASSPLVFSPTFVSQPIAKAKTKLEGTLKFS